MGAADIQKLTKELRQQPVKLLGPRSETLSDLQLQLLADEERGTTLDEVEAEARRAPLADAPPRPFGIHWSFEDPAAVDGAQQEHLAAFRPIRD